MGAANGRQRRGDGGIIRKQGISYAVLTPNLKGYEAAKAAKADEVAIFASASEGFSRANVNATIAESLERFAPIVEAAKGDGMPVRGYVSCVTDCPFDGPTPPAMVARSVAWLRDAGCYEVSLGETIGHGTPESIDAMLNAVLQEMPADRLAGHYHDTKGRALDNIAVSLERGLRTFDSSAGGLGGCPYAPALPAMSTPCGWLKWWKKEALTPASTVSGWRKRQPSRSRFAVEE